MAVVKGQMTPVCGEKDLMAARNQRMPAAGGAVSDQKGAAIIQARRVEEVDLGGEMNER